MQPLRARFGGSFVDREDDLAIGVALYYRCTINNTVAYKSLQSGDG